MYIFIYYVYISYNLTYTIYVAVICRETRHRETKLAIGRHMRTCQITCLKFLIGETSTSKLSQFYRSVHERMCRYNNNDDDDDKYKNDDSYRLHNERWHLSLSLV